MTNDEINAAISAWFTPADYWDTHCRRCHWTFRVEKTPNSTVVHGCTPEVCMFVGELPKTPDYFTSESANARLLEEMPRPILDKPNGVEWFCVADGALSQVNKHADRKTAVVLAFCKFARIEATL